jgi:Histidine kinase-, DNA gyrase B-, and HSP90-like ATPase
MAKKNQYEPVSTQPVKAFFVGMLTRDIALTDALLDLLDNCVDGVQRSISDGTRDSKKPYKGFWAKITVGKDSFTIEDNCGGIPWSEHDRAFRMGRPPNFNLISTNQLLVGAYGIGMKRAIFKLGSVAEIHTQTSDDEYVVSIPAGWMEREDDWNLKVNAPDEPLAHNGTKILVSNLREEVKAAFAAEIFEKELSEAISRHYSIIISKGFKVTVKTSTGTTTVEPKSLGLRYVEKANLDDTVIRPYFFESTPEEGLEVTVVVGLREPIPGVEKALEEQAETTFSTDYAGWTVICNDRVVLYCNKDELTGWGTASVPRYHTQFIAISGIVEFKGDARKLPTTTTKRGLEYSSRLYQQVLNRMREGTKAFTDYTNWWKSNEAEAKLQVAPAPSLELPELKLKIRNSNIKMAAVQTGLVGRQYKPVLPRPAQEKSEVRISFYRPRKQVEKLAEALVPDLEDYPTKDVPRILGELIFDSALKTYKIKK